MLWQSQQDESPAAAAVGWARPSQNWARPKALQSPAFWVPACELSIKQLQSCLLRLASQSADFGKSFHPTGHLLLAGGRPRGCSRCAAPAHPHGRDPRHRARCVPQARLSTRTWGSHPNVGGENWALLRGSGQWLCNFPI